MNKPRWQKKFSVSLYNAITGAGMTTQEFAVVSGIDRHTIGNYLSCKSIPNAFILMKMADVLSVDVRTLIDFHEPINM